MFLFKVFFYKPSSYLNLKEIYNRLNIKIKEDGNLYTCVLIYISITEWISDLIV